MKQRRPIMKKNKRVENGGNDLDFHGGVRVPVHMELDSGKRHGR